MSAIDSWIVGRCAGISWLILIKKEPRQLNGKRTEVGTREDLVAALANNFITVKSGNAVAV
jgi:hypothetical protein